MSYLSSGAVQNDDETQAVAKVYGGIQDLDEAKTHAFWYQIQEALKKVFIRDDPQRLSRALDRLNELRNKVDTSFGSDFPAAVYHLDPFQIAKDLSGVMVATSMQKELYLEILKSIANDPRQNSYRRDLLEQITTNDLARDFPDDPAPSHSD